MRNNNSPEISEDASSSKKEKETALSFGWRKEGHYPRFLYRDVELKDGIKPNLYITKEEQPVLWNHMEVLEQLDLHIKWVKYIILRLWLESVSDKFNIEFYTDKSNKSEKSAWDISILNLTPDEVVELIKSKISEVQQ